MFAHIYMADREGELYENVKLLLMAAYRMKMDKRNTSQKTISLMCTFMVPQKKVTQCEIKCSKHLMN